MIVFDKVVKRFGDHVVLDHLDFRVERGERVALIGPSGSGKTTILRLLMTLEDANGGVIWVEGDPLTHQFKGDKLVKPSQKHLRAVRSKIGMVFQQFNLFPNMTVLENITEAPIHVLGKSKAEAAERARELLATVGLQDKEDAHPTKLSGGQQQRVAIARALAMDPDILLLDEVTSALDPELVADVLGVLRRIAETTDITMLIVTHEMGFARDVADRVLVFDQGRIVEEGDPKQIFTAPREERTRSFLKAVVDH
ncbi:ectoine/hydroxyectoine ABC transporter ATP-binding protein EhuA [Gordonia sp. Z-3]|jgi:polar amino acid transport system ATP-binding protein|uniref:Ectoine/hydroxyectoine ABC transporter ATP-binding protein EhuA n=1 Tax=Gordonia tangerina TaxID=2911060 RepID=A0ABS9DDI4_9ACTN|nr:MULTISPECIES: ectoine/hydroxyectoine ABC transporter ATP-binding protein EhuA [Gordonia]MAU80276.1 ectoine/hydroxyectoine ABC transporter ATP-binding protein EhuA [Gordonia sp. (in: high G+C Gram-positive bacteria)]MCF3937279.1 ectoine/hydroxyectoine ABC transporter ATP-binding protein EhuA [Gordonia tangerina]MED5803894.1 ectoine/hydroxyectoine ABC transporter ATP-binding protein EhuA [Gordonia sp. Z-3]